MPSLTPREDAGLTAIARTIFSNALAACAMAPVLNVKLSALMPPINLDGVPRVLIVAAGKAAGPVLQALLDWLDLPPGCKLQGVLIAPECLLNLPEGIAYFAGGHPLPNAESFAGARTALDLVESAAQAAPDGKTFCFFLITGGASAMMELPLDSSISLEDTVAFHRALVHSGASIAEVNCVRKHFSAVKGGRLGLAAASLPNLTLLVSDVPSGHLDALASGPTLPDRSTVAQCREVLARYDLLACFPPSIQRFFASASLPETPKPEDFAPHALTLLSADDLAEAARAQAEAGGFHTVVDNTCDDWECREAAQYLLARLREVRQRHPRVCLISAGEVTVKVPASARGFGGRNQHFALHAASLLDVYDRPIAVLSAGSDGIDGNSPAAGAVVDGNTIAKGFALGQFSGDALRRFDSFSFFDLIGATIVTGPTGNNLRDLRILLAE